MELVCFDTGLVLQLLLQGSALGFSLGVHFTGEHVTH